jgi:hypothetical protein
VSRQFFPWRAAELFACGFVARTGEIGHKWESRSPKSSATFLRFSTPHSECVTAAPHCAWSIRELMPSDSRPEHACIGNAFIDAMRAHPEIETEIEETKPMDLSACQFKA